MATAILLDSTLKSVHLAHHILSNTTDEVIACYFRLPRRNIKNRYSVVPTEQLSDKVNSIVDKLQSIRNFQFVPLDVENYEIKWTAIPFLELVHYSRTTPGIDKICFSYTKEMIGDNTIDIKDAIAAVYEAESVNAISSPVISYPMVVSNKGMVDAVIDLPEDILTLIFENELTLGGMIQKRKQLLNAGHTRDELFERERSFWNKTHPRYGVETDGSWFIDNDELYGTLVSTQNFRRDYPYYEYLLK